ncbi:WYL domain-containing protein [Nonomuraea sp. ZG12]|uniref:WYL domain-containing protein n=1 Tax=Nonomuraea sp. ZG12 TaxID=3452207 RepID=UPI003F88B5EF
MVHPLGVVAKGPTWYLATNTDAGRRTFRIDRVSSVEPTDDPVHRPGGFDLAESWREIADVVDRKRTPSKSGPCALPKGSASSEWRLGTGLRLEVPRSTAASRS